MAEQVKISVMKSVWDEAKTVCNARETDSATVVITKLIDEIYRLRKEHGGD